MVNCHQKRVRVKYQFLGKRKRLVPIYGRGGGGVEGWQGHGERGSKNPVLTNPYDYNNFSPESINGTGCGYVTVRIATNIGGGVWL